MQIFFQPAVLVWPWVKSFRMMHSMCFAARVEAREAELWLLLAGEEPAGAGTGSRGSEDPAVPQVFSMGCPIPVVVAVLRSCVAQACIRARHTVTPFPSSRSLEQGRRV